MIDADLRRPSLHRVFGGSLTGLTDLVLKRNTPKTVLQQDASSGVYYLAAGKLSTSPIDLLASTEFRQLLKGSEQRFDRIIIDSPPVLAVADARVLAGYVNQTVYIVRWSKTPRRLARLGYEVLRQNGARLLGPRLHPSRRRRHAVRRKAGLTAARGLNRPLCLLAGDLRWKWLA